MYTGLTGKVVIGGEVAYISNWSVESTRDIIEITQLGVKTKTKKAGLQSWSASADGAIEFRSEKSHKFLFEAMNKGEEVLCEFFLDNGAVSGKVVKFSGQGLIESLSIDLSAEDKGNISISISGTGELQYPDRPGTGGQEPVNP